jgi:pyrroloquinoline-quinone synthase
MQFASTLEKKLSEYDLLTHPFYQYWNEGKLSLETLKEYAKQYYHHVEAFPRSLSAIHSKCESKESRKIILENLVEEEFSKPNHPELWLDFAKGLGVNVDEVTNIKLDQKTAELVASFKECSGSSYEEGIGALFAHEWQYSKIATTKKNGLESMYNIKDANTIEFFKVHADIDVWHAEQLTTLLNKLPKEKHDLVEKGAIKAAKALWGFLDGMLEYHHA